MVVSSSASPISWACRILAIPVAVLGVLLLSADMPLAEHHTCSCSLNTPA